jgi:HSP20 family protein
MSGNVVPWRWKKKRVPVGPEKDTVSNLHQQINRLFNDVVSGSSILPDFMSEPLAQLGERLTTFAPTVNVRKTESAVIISVEVPGMDERDVELSLTSQGLTIRGERRPDFDERDDQGWNYVESSYGPFERIVPLGELRIDQDKVEASASKGIVTITLPLLAITETLERKVSIKIS